MKIKVHQGSVGKYAVLIFFEEKNAENDATSRMTSGCNKHGG
jgi:hypothetical protein